MIQGQRLAGRPPLASKLGSGVTQYDPAAPQITRESTISCLRYRIIFSDNSNIWPWNFDVTTLKVWIRAFSREFTSPSRVRASDQVPVSPHPQGFSAAISTQPQEILSSFTAYLRHISSRFSSTITIATSRCPFNLQTAFLYLLLDRRSLFATRATVGTR